MLHENPSMTDIDVNHWRNLQALLLESAKEKRRIIVIHEDGKLLKFVHSQRAEIVKPIDRVDDPHRVAEQVYRANADRTDFVAVFERRAFDEWAARFQDTWRPDEDLDAFVVRTYAMMDDYPDGIVTYPGPARSTLGLQWRLGSSYGEVLEAVRAFVPTDSTVVFGIFDGDATWATLVLRFDADHRADVVTTVDPSRLPATTGTEAAADAIVEWVGRTYGPCSLGLFADLGTARELLASQTKPAAFRQAVADGRLRARPAPEALARLLAPA